MQFKIISVIILLDYLSLHDMHMKYFQSSMDKENRIKLVYGEIKKGNQAGSENRKSDSTEKTFPCFLCNKSFNQKHSLAKHLKSHKSGEGHECHKCKKTFAATRDLKKHIDIVHLNKADEYKKECPICHTRVQQLKTHIRFIHRNEAKSSDFNCICPQCDKTFSNDYKVKRHIETVHEGVKNWQCTICPKRFYDKKDLGRHVKGVHMGQKVDTWRNKKSSSRKPQGQGQVVVTKNFLPTVDVSSPKEQISLPVNVMDEECEERSDGEENATAVNAPGDVKGTGAEDREDKNNIDRINVPEEYNDKEEDDSESDDDEPLEVAEVDPVYSDELDCRFQVCRQRVDEEGNLVLEIEEKMEPPPPKHNEGVSTALHPHKSSPDKSKMVTLRWGEQNTLEEGLITKDDGDLQLKVNKVSSKVIDLNLKLEDIIEDNADIATDDFVLPEVVGDLPDWFLNTSTELDSVRINQDSEALTSSTKSSSDTQARESFSQDDKTAFRCGACGKMFISLEFLKSHIEKSHIHHKGDLMSDVTKPQVLQNSPDTNEMLKSDTIVCTIESCGKIFEGKARKMQYKRHVERVHLALKNKQCPKCDLKFYEQRDLTRHIEAIHLGLRTICPEAGCAKPVVRLDQHMKMVHGHGADRCEAGRADKSSKCPECGATFSRIYDMARHRENVHRGLKNFSCDKCDRKFSDKRDLKRHHDAVHLNIKQKKSYSCSLCPKTFKFKKLLDLHRLNDHEEQSSKPAERASTSGSSSTVIVTVNNIKSTKEEAPVVADPGPGPGEEELNTVEIDGQLFLVQQSEAGLALLPVVRTAADTEDAAITLAVDGFAIQN